jgi:predicted solute-binding protein
VVIVPFDKILETVQTARRTRTDHSRSAVDLQQEGISPRAGYGPWWKDKFDLPLPLGGNVLLRSLGTT